MLNEDRASVWDDDNVLQRTVEQDPGPLGGLRSLSLSLDMGEKGIETRNTADDIHTTRRPPSARQGAWAVPMRTVFRKSASDLQRLRPRVGAEAGGVVGTRHSSRATHESAVDKGRILSEHVGERGALCLLRLISTSSGSAAPTDADWPGEVPATQPGSVSH